MVKEMRLTSQGRGEGRVVLAKGRAYCSVGAEPQKGHTCRGSCNYFQQAEWGQGHAAGLSMIPE